MNADFVAAMRQLADERGVSYEVLRDTVIAALESAYRKRHGVQGAVRVELDEASNRFRVISVRDVVEQVENAHLEVSLAHAIRVRPDVAVGDQIEVEVTPKDFGRIAAQTAKQVVVQRLREAERDAIFQEFVARKDDLITGEIERRENDNVYVSLGRVEALLPPREQIPSERPYAVHRRLKLTIQDVRRSAKNAQVIVSRTSKSLLLRLFELEVPEVYDGVVEIKAIEREPGLRAKIAVLSHDEKVDPVGACVGHRGARVQAVVDELAGEKIDIIRYHDEIKVFMANALNPADVAEIIPNEEARAATVVVPDDQLSLAIGKRGQNVRLAARLTGWKIDIVGLSEWTERKRAEAQVDPATVEVRVYDVAAELGIASKEAIELLATMDVEVASHADTINGGQAEALRALVQEAAEGTPAPEENSTPESDEAVADDEAPEEPAAAEDETE
jgi:transcription termination/antitermination protein NusA